MWSYAVDLWKGQHEEGRDSRRKREGKEEREKGEGRVRRDEKGKEGSQEEGGRMFFSVIPSQ